MTEEYEATNLYKRLRKEHYFYCQGKNPKALKAACEYIKRLLTCNLDEFKTFKQLANEYGVSAVTIGKRCKEIAKLFNIDLQKLKNRDYAMIAILDELIKKWKNTKL